MYRTNLPDCVVIPESLMDYVEGGGLTDQAKLDAQAWVDERKVSSQFFRDFWREHIREDIRLCKTYGIPEGVRFFTYVLELIEVAW